MPFPLPQPHFPRIRRPLMKVFPVSVAFIDHLQRISLPRRITETSNEESECG